MKNLQQLLLIILFLFSFGKKNIAQDCGVPQAFKTLEGNNISAHILINGTLFHDNMNTGFRINTQPDPLTTTITSAGLWMGGYDNNGELKSTAGKYNSYNSDYAAGPILLDNGQMTFDCENYDQLWEVYGYEIQQHIADFSDNGIINNIFPNIYGYPARQNQFFESFHGFNLPNTSHGLAPFFDQNNDGIYNPSAGDYPLPESVHPNAIPSHMIWGIYNNGDINQNNESINAEIHQTVWAFNCADNELLNNSIFTSHKIINRDSSPLDSMFIGFWTDMELGCNTDDYLGCIPEMNTYYFYNSDSIDGLQGSECYNILTFGDNPPVQAVTILNQEMNNFIYHGNGIGGSVGPLTPPNSAIEHYSLLTGNWWWFPYPVHLTYGGSGAGSSSQLTKFAFPNHPNDTLGWSLAQTPLSYDERYSLANMKFGTFQPDQSITITKAYTFYQDENLDHLSTVDLVYDNTPLLQQMYDNQFEGCDNIFCSNDCVWTGDANKDSTVSMYDFLQIGLNFGATGTIRNHPLIWSPYESQNWNTPPLGENLKHADCNGNGIIDSLDFQESIFHFGKSYKLAPPIDVYNYGPEISIESHPNFNTITPGETGIAKFKLNQEEDLYGVAFTVEYNPELFTIELINPISPWDNSTIDNSFLFQKTQPSKGEHHFAYVKTDGENSISNNQDILRISFEANNTDYELIQAVFRLKNIKAILNDGTILDYGSNDFIVNVFNLNGTGIILNDENLEEANIQIFPNPTTDILNIKMENSSLATFSIFDIYGKKVLEKTEMNQSDIQLSTSTFSQGVYFLRIEIEGKEFVQKFIQL